MNSIALAELFMDSPFPFSSSRPNSSDPAVLAQRRSQRAVAFSTPRRDSWASCQSDSPYTVGSGSRLESILSPERYSFSPDPRDWDFGYLPEHEEDDDDLHNPVLVIATKADPDTPYDVYEKASWKDPHDVWTLVFSDEFNVEGRSFYPGDDPYWEAADLHYWATNDMEWYDPATVTTLGGSLSISLLKAPSHGLNFSGGMISSWNKFCFTGGLLETSVVLPGMSNVMGLWPAVWTMGNLGRAGYGASLDGLWPYTYDSCDVGTLPNQTLNSLPAAARQNGDPYHNYSLSYLPGQRLSRCTCPGEDHPGPHHDDGSLVGRAAPEIDCFEGKVRELLKGAVGEVSQSAQWAPYNAGYAWFNTSENMVIANPYKTRRNPYVGGVLQQVTSAITGTDQECYMRKAGCYEVFGFEYKPGFDDAYITWIANNAISWTLHAAGMASDPLVEISARPVPQEPMYIVINLGLSRSFGPVDLDHLIFPNHMRVDYIRVYQPSDAINIGCSPSGFPTESYIQRHIEAYTNPNLTTWRDDYGGAWPKNRLVETCPLRA
ncbi:hypothetical protein HGRIS_011344 [Hohenbuehelia grisea]|uniref:GH16 domain-containing protein n=1 Tax=Hohenbuehelia grisea TaxID=104357 RepID=A0ABR3JX03_9AGAR